MRILFDARRAVHRANGISRIIDGLLGALVELDQQNEYLVLWGERNPLPAHAPANFEARHIDLDINSLAVNWFMPKMALNWHANVAYFPFWLMPLWMPCPSVVAIHDLIFSKFPQYLPPFRRIVYGQYTSLAVRFARRVHVLSTHSQSDLIRLYRAQVNRVDVIPPDADARFVQRDRESWDMEVLEARGLSAPFVLYVGNHKPHKNLDRLINAYGSVSDRMQSKLVIVGAKASYEDPYSLPYLELVQKLSLQDRVQFVGQIEDTELSLYYNAARFVVFPSLYEGFGLSPLEAMRCGTPVACSSTSSLPEVVGDAALTFDPADERQIADAMLQLDRSTELRDELSRRGLERASMFSWRKSASKWLQSLEQASGVSC